MLNLLKGRKIFALFASLVLLGLLFTVFQLYQNTQSKKQSMQTEIKTSDENKIYADLNGDGKQETLQLILGADTEPPSVISLVAYNEDGKEIGRLPGSMPIQVPMSGSGKVYVPIKKDKNQFVSFDFSVGPHSSETMFFGLFKLKTGGMGVLPVCLTDNVYGPSDCLFWSGEIGGLMVDDFDKDGYMDVVEIVDEYPKDGPITADIEKMINEQFKDVGQDAANGMIRIAKREQGGRGNRVVWGIDRYNGEYFEQQTGANYDKYFALLIKTQPDLIKKSHLSKDSLEYNEFVRKFWAGQ